MNNIWTIKSALEWTEGYLAEKGDENPRLSAQWLLSEATGLTRMHLFVNFDRPLSEDERSTLRDYVRRRGAGEPLQYITGEVAFRHITVKVRPGVLIPRPETEVLVSEVLAMLPAPAKHEAQWNPEAAERESAAVEAVKKALDEAGVGLIGSEEAPISEDPARPLLVADLCTGTGCIACSLAAEHPDVRVIATDIAPEAVALARKNAAALELDDRVAVLECSLGTGIGEKRLGTFDAVVSNPPYVPTSVLADIPREVADFEPALALDGGADGLDVFRPLAAWAARALKPGGVLACELHEGHLDAARAVAEAAGFTDVRIADDLAGRPRVLVGRKGAGASAACDAAFPSEAR
ncbi:MAG: peptide chain release factor N(5)-glutamine methyltransferase [Enterorhabdus sp.]|nr:peptide chain release factor N(5)-glutamine methyltransferase [Enterorhabdus sp.]